MSIEKSKLKIFEISGALEKFLRTYKPTYWNDYKRYSTGQDYKKKVNFGNVFNSEKIRHMLKIH